MMKRKHLPRLLAERPRGVTLIELMIVVALIGVMAGFGGPPIYRAVQRANSKGSAREITNAFRFARSQAMSRGEPLWLQVTNGTGPGDRGRIRIARKYAANEPAPRSCREYNGGANINFAAANCGPGEDLSCVYESDIDVQSGTQMIHGQDPAGVICFSPDGRVLSDTGRPTTPGAAACPGEAFVVWTGDSDTVIGGALSDCVTSGDPTERLEAKIDRQSVHMYRIAIPFNGSVKMEQ